jgi:hypothetical protein
MPTNLDSSHPDLAVVAVDHVPTLDPFPLSTSDVLCRLLDERKDRKLS